MARTASIKRKELKKIETGVWKFPTRKSKEKAIIRLEAIIETLEWAQEKYKKL